jgi:hypothetical protein
MIGEILAGSLAEMIAAFEQGSGLSVQAIGIAMSVIGVGTVMALAVWALVQQLPALGHGDLNPTQFWFRALVATLVMVGCATVFALGSPVSP